MDLKVLKDQLDLDLAKASISSMMLFDRFRFMDEKSKETGAYFDARYIPFYYHLGKRLSPQTLLHAGFGLGLESGVFLLGCRTVENFLAFQDPMEQFYSLRLGMKNIKTQYKKKKQFYVGGIQDDILVSNMDKNEWNTIIITELMLYDQHRLYFDMLWDHLSFDGLMIVEYVVSHEANKKAFEDFCKIINRDPIIINTRYGVGIIEK